MQNKDQLLGSTSPTRMRRPAPLTLVAAAESEGRFRRRLNPSSEELYSKAQEILNQWAQVPLQDIGTSYKGNSVIIECDESYIHKLEQVLGKAFIESGGAIQIGHTKPQEKDGSSYCKIMILAKKESPSDVETLEYFLTHKKEEILFHIRGIVSGNIRFADHHVTSPVTAERLYEEARQILDAFSKAKWTEQGDQAFLAVAHGNHSGAFCGAILQTIKSYLVRNDIISFQNAKKEMLLPFHFSHAEGTLVANNGEVEREQNEFYITLPVKFLREGKDMQFLICRKLPITDHSLKVVCEEVARQHRPIYMQ